MSLCSALSSVHIAFAVTWYFFYIEHQIYLELSSERIVSRLHVWPLGIYQKFFKICLTSWLQACFLCIRQYNAYCWFCYSKYTAIQYSLDFRNFSWAYSNDHSTVTIKEKWNSRLNKAIRKPSIDSIRFYFSTLVVKFNAGNILGKNVISFQHNNDFICYKTLRGLLGTHVKYVLTINNLNTIQNQKFTTYHTIKGGKN